MKELIILVNNNEISCNFKSLEKTEDGFEIKVKEADVQNTEEFFKENNVDFTFDGEKLLSQNRPQFFHQAL